MRDLVVVGGGPVGLVTALHAARSGLTVTVVEARAAPVDKACGEGLMPMAVRRLAGLRIEPRGMPIHGIRYTDGRCSAVADFPASPGLGVRRLELQSRLLEAVSAAGVDLVRGRVDGVEQGADGVTAGGVRGRHLIAADGLHSPLRRALDLDARAGGRPRWGMRAHFDVEPWSCRVEVHWAATGEAYVTPVGPRCVGVAVLGPDRGSFADRLAAFPDLAQRLPASPSGPVLGAGPLHRRASGRVAGRVLLVGDAAGYVDALTGEGLAMGFACAEAAVRRVVSGEVAAYERDHARLTRRYRLLTAALVSATSYAAVRRRIVPAAHRLPWLFEAAVGQLAR